MGTPDFSVPTLESLIDSDHEVVGVVTQPDKPKGRGKQLQMTPVKMKAIEHNIPVYQPIRVKQEGFVDEMRSLQPDLVVTIAFGQILTKEFLDMPRLGCLNVHASLLPKLRGAAPIQWSIINGDMKTGVTTMYMDTGIDTGDMLLKEEVMIEPTDTGGTLHDKLSQIGGPLILETIKQLEEGTLVRQKQNDDDATYVTMLDKQMGNVVWNKPAIEIERLIRGLNPWPSAYTHVNGKILKLWEAKVIELEDNDHMPGSVFEINKEGLVVKCADNGLLITSLQLQGKKRMAAADFLRGYTIEVGSILGQN